MSNQSPSSPFCTLSLSVRLTRGVSFYLARLAAIESSSETRFLLLLLLLLAPVHAAPGPGETPPATPIMRGRVILCKYFPRPVFAQPRRERERSNAPRDPRFNEFIRDHLAGERRGFGKQRIPGCFREGSC